ncbi:VOC family protein [Phenylobacterium sp. LjRoot219]|uniref:VOC family protein n=1 Tax=Phenylobacterium sp. LjRoot219 TaxID=3342283 RepID=UPI003ECE9A7F
MPVTGLNHVNIRTTDVASSAKFYVDLFDFEFRQGPVVMGNQSNWLFDRQGNAIIHFRVLGADSTSTGPIDHVALNCEGKADILSRLEARNIKFAMAENLTPGVTQVFVTDPHGVALELNFTSA